MVTKTSVNIGSGNDLLPDGTKPLPDSMVTGVIGIHHIEISQKMRNVWWQN